MCSLCIMRALTSVPLQFWCYREFGRPRKVVADYLTVDSEAFTFVGKERTDLLSSYIQAMEHGKIVNPVINLMYDEHKFADNAALFSATKHLPDTIAAGALAWRAAVRARGADIGAARKARARARKKMRERS